MLIQVAEAKTTNPLIAQSTTSFVGSFDYTLSMFNGCYFGCSYCYVPAVQRGLPARRGGWGSYVDLRSRSVEWVRKQQDRLQGASIFMSATTDPYQPVEAQARLTRALLEVLAEMDFGFLLISTRSGLVLRDLDLFTDARLNGRVEVGISIPSDLDEVHEALEPATSSFAGRFTVARRLRERGVPTRIHAAPLAVHSSDFVRRAGVSAGWLWIDGAAHGAKRTEPAASLLYDHAAARKIAQAAGAVLGDERVGYGREQFAWRWQEAQAKIVAPPPRKERV